MLSCQQKYPCLWHSRFMDPKPNQKLLGLFLNKQKFRFYASIDIYDTVFVTIKFHPHFDKKLKFYFFCSFTGIWTSLGHTKSGTQSLNTRCLLLPLHCAFWQKNESVMMPHYWTQNFKKFVFLVFVFIKPHVLSLNEVKVWLL